MILAACAACRFDLPASTAPPADAIDGPSEDRDGDGVDDEIDLCPDVADPLQRDHDGDLRGDACDRCPHLPSPDDPDQDGDGVGDACDPALAAGGDARALWIGFYSEDAARIADPAQWSQVGAWSITDGWVRVTAAGVDVLRSTTLVQRAAVWSKIRLDDVSDLNLALGVVSGVDGPSGASTQFYQCALFKNGSRINARSFIAGTTVSDNYATWPEPLVNGAIFEVASRFAGLFECSYAAPSTTVRSTRSATAGNVEFIVQDAAVSFDYLFVVEQGS